MHRPRSLLAFAAALSLGAVAASPAASVLGPPWISIEYPGNPFDRANPNAYLYVHTFHHANAIAARVSGTAEGLVGGERRSVALQFAKTERPGTYALRRQWPEQGTWMLVISTKSDGGDGATALVEIGPTGDVSAVRVPTTVRNGWTIPVAVGAREVDEALRTRATRLAAGARRSE